MTEDDVTLLDTEHGLLVVVNGEALFQLKDGQWKGKEPGLEVCSAMLMDSISGKHFDGFEFWRGEELLDWVFYYHEGEPSICRISETRRLS